MFDHQQGPAAAGVRAPGEAMERAGAGGRPAALGSIAKSVHTRRARFRLQRVAGRLLPEERVARCLWTVVSNCSGVVVLLREGRARFNGLQTCGSVWACPVCAARVAESRRLELNAALAWARERGLVPVMLTLTARHAAGDDLRRLLDAMKDAKRALRRSRAWARLKPVLAGTVTATEVTFGRAGWHPHFHELLFVQAEDEAAAVRLVETLRGEWARCLHRGNLDGNGHAFRVDGAAKAGRYVAKFGSGEAVGLADCSGPGGSWGAAEEMTRAASKVGKGLHPFGLLERAAAGDRRAAAAFIEFSAAFKGRRQLVWSPDFKDRIGLDDVSDEVVAEARREDLDEIPGGLATPLWRRVRHLPDARPRILEAAEDGWFSDLLDRLREALEPLPPS